jgi:hypothetical protein
MDTQKLYAIANLMMINHRWARSEGFPYRRGGVSTAHGWDCIGYICWLLNSSGILFEQTNTVGFAALCRSTPDPAFGALAELLKFEVYIPDAVATPTHVSWMLGDGLYVESNPEIVIEGIRVPPYALWSYDSSCKLIDGYPDDTTYGRHPKWIGSMLNAGAFTPENHYDTGPDWTSTPWEYSYREAAGILKWIANNIEWYLGGVERYVWDGITFSGGLKFGSGNLKHGMGYHWLSYDVADYNNDEFQDYGQKPMVYAALTGVAIKMFTAAGSYITEQLENPNATPGVWDNVKAYLENFSAIMAGVLPIPGVEFNPVMPNILLEVLDAIITEYTTDDSSGIAVANFRTNYLSAFTNELKYGVNERFRDPIGTTMYLDSTKVRLANWLGAIHT